MSGPVAAPGSGAAAADQLGSAIGLFETGPAADRSFGCEAIARINLALARLRSGDLDAVDLRPVFSLPADKRIDALPQQLAIVRSELAHPRYQGSAQARELDERIEDFSRETIAAALHDLPAGPA